MQIDCTFSTPTNHTHQPIRVSMQINPTKMVVSLHIEARAKIEAMQKESKLWRRQEAGGAAEAAAGSPIAGIFLQGASSKEIIVKHSPHRVIMAMT